MHKNKKTVYNTGVIEPSPMLLYHGSSHQLKALQPQQAEAGEGIVVPEDELLHAIYLTPDRGSAIAMAVRPDGVTDIRDRSITFEHPELFDPEKTVYLYIVETDAIPKGHLRKIDDWQYAVEGLDELAFASMEEHKAGEIEQYYELTNWKREDKKETEDEPTDVAPKTRR